MGKGVPPPNMREEDKYETSPFNIGQPNLQTPDFGGLKTWRGHNCSLVGKGKKILIFWGVWTGGKMLIHRVRVVDEPFS